MKKLFKYALMFAAAMSANMAFVACDDDKKDDPTTEVSAIETAILKNYVDAVVIPTYKQLADYAIQLAEDCEDLSTQERVDQACANWIAARRYWELSEAFLFGPASDYSIDPHIDSWPLNLVELAEVLKKGDIEARIASGTAGYGLLGFHAVEYVIFKEGSTGTADNRNRVAAEITAAEAKFAEAVAEDMRDQCIRLEAAWAGIDGVSAKKREILEEAELLPSFNYGELLTSAGLAGNTKYKTTMAAFEEILVGASGIANEVGTAKISDPMKSHNWSDVESPHAWNSVQDFVDNLKSVRNVWYGTMGDNVAPATHSVCNHVKGLDAQVAANVSTAIAEAITALENMPKPFRNYIAADTDAASKALIQKAVDACQNVVDQVDKAVEVVKK